VPQGRLLVLEGPDGVGKSSTARDVAERLRSLAIRHSVLAFPGREPGTLGKLVYDIHHDPKSFDIPRMAEAAKQALHVAAHLDAIERRIGPLLHEGEHVVLDRFWWSTWVYGLVGGVSPSILEALIEAERIQWGSIQPSLVILLDRDRPIECDEDLNGWRRIRDGYLTLASKEEDHYPIEVVQNVGTLEQTASRVVDLALSRGFDLKHARIRRFHRIRRRLVLRDSIKTIPINETAGVALGARERTSTQHPHHGFLPPY
jgi:dTMP kinase